MISIKNVNKWYGDFQVLTDCSTTIKKGEVTGECSWEGAREPQRLEGAHGLP